MASFSGTFSAVNDTSGILILQPQEVATITLTKTASNPWSVSLRQIIGGSAEVGLATYTTDQSATQYKNTTNSAQTLRLRCMVLTNTDTIAYAFADAPSSDVVFSWSDPEGNLLFSITEAGPVVPSNVTLTAGNAVNMAKGADIASAATIDLTNATGNWVNVTGTTTITAITLSAGLQRLVRFTGILTLTNGASLVLPSAANITTAAGDYALFIGDASGVVRCAYFSRATGVPVGPAAAGTLTGTTLASNVVTSSLTSVGTLSAGAVPASLVTAGTFGAGNYVVGGLMTAGKVTVAGTYTAASTTPSVLNVDTLHISNVGATTITDFTNGVEGQIIKLTFGDANTTVNRNNCYLAGGLNFISGNHYTLVLKKRGSIWEELSRSLNA